jgi:hypothetical protein
MSMSQNSAQMRTSPRVQVAYYGTNTKTPESSNLLQNKAHGSAHIALPMLFAASNHGLLVVIGISPGLHDFLGFLTRSVGSRKVVDKVD